MAMTDNNASGIEEEYTYYFSFNESNISIVKRKLLAKIVELRNERCNVMFINPLPPCILGEMISDKSLRDSNNLCVLSDKDKVINHNLCFKKISPFKVFTDHDNSINNSYRAKSGSISIKCLRCKFFNDNLCAGIYNKKFESEKHNLEKKFTPSIYKAIRKSYNDGFVMFGSICKNNCCKFCHEKVMPSYMKPNVSSLSLQEIEHFMNYFNEKFILGFGVHNYCVSGEFLDHPKWKEILDLTNCLIYKYTKIVTNALNLDDSAIKKIKEFDIELVISTPTLDVKKRRYLMGYSNDFDIKRLFMKLDENKVSYSVWFTLLKSLLDSGQLKEDIAYVINSTNSSYIQLNHPISSKFISSEMKKELNIPYNLVDKYKKELQNEFKNYEIYGYECNDTSIKEKFSKIYSTFKDYCPNIPKFLFHTRHAKKFVDDVNLNEINIKGIILKPYDLGDDSSGSIFGITVNDFILNYKDNFSIIPENSILIFPRQSFNDDLDDYYLNSINKLCKEVKNKIILV